MNRWTDAINSSVAISTGFSRTTSEPNPFDLRIIFDVPYYTLYEMSFKVAAPATVMKIRARDFIVEAYGYLW